MRIQDRGGGGRPGEQPGAGAVWPRSPSSRFELAPPRNFLLPAVLLLLLEAPAHGYRLVDDLRGLRFGAVDRPSVYRALAHLEGDGLVESWSDSGKTGHARHIYGLTERGERALRAWMGVIKEERDGLDRVLRRYTATGTIDAVLASVEGGWATVAGHGGSPVSSTSEIGGHWGMAGQSVLRPAPWVGSEEASSAGSEEKGSAGSEEEGSARPEEGGSARPDGEGGPSLRRFVVVPDRSAVLVEARSTVGPITFGAIGATGVIETEVRGAQIYAGTAATAHLEINVNGLASGNRLYDAELLRRIDARRYPVVSLDLRECGPMTASGQLRLAGEVTVHGVTRALQGTVTVTLSSERTLVVTGEQVFDIRDYDIVSPTVLMLRIYPDVVVQLHLEAELHQ